MRVSTPGEERGRRERERERERRKGVGGGNDVEINKKPEGEQKREWVSR
jgi:hypothetical protein